MGDQRGTGSIYSGGKRGNLLYNSWGSSPLGALLPSHYWEEIWRFPNRVLQGYYEIDLNCASNHAVKS